MASGEIAPLSQRVGESDSRSGRGLLDRRLSPEGDRRPDDLGVELEVLRAELLRAREATASVRAERAQLERDLRDQQRRAADLLRENASLGEAGGSWPNNCDTSAQLRMGADPEAAVAPVAAPEGRYDHGSRLEPVRALPQYGADVRHRRRRP